MIMRRIGGWLLACGGGLLGVLIQMTFPDPSSLELVLLWSGVAAVVLLGLFLALRREAVVGGEQGGKPRIDRSIRTENQSGGLNVTGDNVTFHAEDRSTRRRIRDLLASVDPRILTEIDKGKDTLDMRMEPFHIQRLQELLAEDGGGDLGKIRGFGRRMAHSQINNGTLGPSAPVDMQIEVLLDVYPLLRA